MVCEFKMNLFFFTNRDSGMFLTVSCVLPQNVALISLNFGSCLHSLFGKKKDYISKEDQWMLLEGNQAIDIHI